MSFFEFKKEWAASLNGFRLTLESGVPVSTSNQAAKSTIYVTPYTSNVISLWDGALWQPTEAAQYAISLTGSGGDVAVGPLSDATPYDVFAYLSGGALACEVLAWTNGTTRDTAVVRTDGVLTKSGDKTRRLLGTIYTTSTTTTEDSEDNRLIWNSNNQVLRIAKKSDTSSHEYSIDLQRDWNSIQLRATWIQGESQVVLCLLQTAQATTNTDGARYVISWKIDGSNSTRAKTLIGIGGGNAEFGVPAAFRLAAGYHYADAREQGAGSGTQTFFAFTGVIGIMG